MSVLKKTERPIVASGCGICVIVLAMVVGPFYSPDVFSWIRHSASEQAGQQMAGAWIMRAGFVAYGVGTFAASLLVWNRRPLVRAAMATFGLGLIGTAFWSNASIIPGVSSDMHEDWLHSVASAVVGTAFGLACALRLFGPSGSRRDQLAWAGLVISIAVPVAMSSNPEIRGLLQRLMFAFSFIFVIREFARPSR